MLRILALPFSIFLLSNAIPAYAQMDEIVVTGSRIVRSAGDTDTSPPGIFYERKGDFLLLEVRIENDSREFGTRLEELTKTVEGIIEAAEEDAEITLSLIDDSFVRPLSVASFEDGIRGGSRPDTSVATLQVKTDIPETVADSFKLATKLGKFVDDLEEVGRTTITNSDEISVSVVNPYQYRETVMAMVLSEIKDVKDVLGDDYRVVLRGLDKEMTWVRSGDLNLAFTLPYTYDIIPNNLATYTIERKSEDDY